MEKFLKRNLVSKEQISSSKINFSDDTHTKQPRVEINLDELAVDPGLRPKILSYHPNDRDKIRRYYLQKGPCQPRHHDFPKRKFGEKFRRFCPTWFNEFGNWLEYSIAKDAAYCLCCYLFRQDIGKQSGGDIFVAEGFTNWKQKEKFNLHIGGPNSSHNNAYKKCQDLLKQKQHIEAVFSKQSDQARDVYRNRLTASVDCIRFLLKQGLAFRGHDESENSLNQGNFLELLRFLADHNENINNVVLQNAPENHQLIAPDIQKDIVNAAAIETTNAIIDDLGDDFFSIIVDESRDISNKEEMAVALRYVQKKGDIVERFLGIVHVSDTTASSLKAAIESLFLRYGLTLSRIRGQGYDGASNMQGEFNGLKSLILKENSSAFYIHCFAHQLQLTLVATAKNHIQVASLFNLVATLLNVIGGSCKRLDMLREKQIAQVTEALEIGELLTGRGMNQDIGLKRAADTRWGSHYGTLVNLILLYSSIIDVLEIIKEGGLNADQRAEANGLLVMLQSFDFVFSMHLMKNVLGITNELSQALQRKDQDIINAMKLVEISKQRLQILRDSGWESLLDEVSLFCTTHDIDIPNMEEGFSSTGRSRRRVQGFTNAHYYRVDLMYSVVDMQLLELNDRFTETNTELLICLSCLAPDDSFSAFNKHKLIRFAKFYPADFSSADLVVLDNQLETYMFDMQSTDEFSALSGIGSLAKKLVETKKHIVYPLVYLLVKLALILPVATATVERAFSAMKIVKNRLRNRMGDAWMNDCLVTYIEREVFNEIDNELILQRFQNMKSRRGQL